MSVVFENSVWKFSYVNDDFFSFFFFFCYGVTFGVCKIVRTTDEHDSSRPFSEDDTRDYFVPVNILFNINRPIFDDYWQSRAVMIWRPGHGSKYAFSIYY